MRVQEVHRQGTEEQIDKQVERNESLMIVLCEEIIHQGLYLFRLLYDLAGQADHISREEKQGNAKDRSRSQAVSHQLLCISFAVVQDS